MEPSITIDISKLIQVHLKYVGVVLTTVFLLEGALYPQGIIFSGRKYTVTRSSVVQGKDTAKAISPDEIESDYRSNYHVKTPDEIQIKFSINGADNEAPPGQNHTLIIDSKRGGCEPQTYVFGVFAASAGSAKEGDLPAFLSRDTRVTIRLDMTHVIATIKKAGYFTTFDGRRISAADFKGVYIAGNTLPLSWDFRGLSREPQFALHDSAGTGIYKVTILFKKEQYPGLLRPKVRKWALSRDISDYPIYHSGSVLSEALYNKSLEEMLQDIRPDGAFMAGAMWPGVWTRDASYSGLLSLAILNPDAVRASLLKKVNNDRIIQDTGTGGSWPVSSDRMVWTLAAWEVYKVTGDTTWLQKAYNIVRNSAMDDLHTLVDPKTGLFHGESSFLDWREQTYPKWMDPKDIFCSEDLGTNAVHYETYRILAKMARALGESPALYLTTARRIKEGINRYLWMKRKGYYGQYLYGRNFQSLSTRSESLGEALCVLFGIAGPARATKVISNTPVTRYGITCIYPQTPGLAPYHDDAVWPFVESYWAWASSTTQNMPSVSRAIAAVYRAAAFFLTNKENMVASTGDYLGTQINSDRQLWSVAGDLAIVYRVLFGMRFHQNYLAFSPCVPEAFGPAIKLENFKYRNSDLTLSITGYGDKVNRITLDGRELEGDRIPDTLIGKHTVAIVMTIRAAGGRGVKLVPDEFTPETPHATLTNSMLEWKPVEGAASYRIYRNGKEISNPASDRYTIAAANSYSEYQVMAVSGHGTESFLSRPLKEVVGDPVITVQAEAGADSVESQSRGYTGTGYIKLDLRNPSSPNYRVNVQNSGTYAIDVRYANGSGPINTNNKCGIRTLMVDHDAVGPVVMPQRGAGDWESWGYSNAIHCFLKKGSHILTITFNKHDNNMNGRTNTALVDAVRLTMISKR